MTGFVETFYICPSRALSTATLPMMTAIINNPPPIALGIKYVVPTCSHCLSGFRKYGAEQPRPPLACPSLLHASGSKCELWKPAAPATMPATAP